MRVSTTKNITYTSNKNHAVVDVHQFNDVQQKIINIDLSNSYSGHMGDKGVIPQLEIAIEALNELRESLITKEREE